MNSEDKIKVFLVDDDTMFTESLKHVLTEERTDITTFPNGEACLKKLQNEDPEVVVLDYYLNSTVPSAMNGMQVLNKIKEHNPDTAVIMLSSQDNVSVAIDTLKYGAYDYIAKGQSAFVKIKNDIKHICDNKEQTDDYSKTNTNLKRINLLILAIVMLLFILSRML